MTRHAPALCLLLVVGCGGAPRAPDGPRTLHAADLYPLSEGSAWSYDVDTGDGDSVLAISRVTRVTGRVVEVATGAGAIRYELRPEGVYRAGKGSWLLHDPIETGARWSSGTGVTAHIDSVSVLIETQAGRFEGCVRVNETGADSGQTVQTVYCPDVGPVEVVSEMFVRDQQIRVVARLRGYQIGGEPP